MQDEDKHITSFLMTWGKFRYLRTPKEYLASGDGYTNRYDMITTVFRNIKLVIYGTFVWAKNLEQAFKQVAAYMAYSVQEWDHPEP